MVYQHRLENKFTAAIPAHRDSESFSTISVIVFAVNIVAK